MTYQSLDTLGTAMSAGTAKELSSLVGMALAPRSVVLEEEIVASRKLPSRVSVLCTGAGVQPFICARKRSDYIRFYNCSLMCCALFPCLMLYV